QQVFACPAHQPGEAFHRARAVQRNLEDANARLLQRIQRVGRLFGLQATQYCDDGSIGKETAEKIHHPPGSSLPRASNPADRAIVNRAPGVTSSLFSEVSSRPQSPAAIR